MMDFVTRIDNRLACLRSDNSARVDCCDIAREADAEIERLRAEFAALRANAERYRWLCQVPIAIDTVADPDNLIQVWIGTSPARCYKGRTLTEAIDAAREKEETP